MFSAALFMCVSCTDTTGIKNSPSLDISENMFDSMFSAGVSNPDVHVVRKGDTIAGIARRYGMTVRAVKRLNSLTSHVIYPGMKIALRADAVSGAGVTPPDMSQPLLPHPRKKHPEKGFRWPVSGRIASRFSPRHGRDGIEIQTQNGAEVSAVDNGRVMFCGYIPALGNTVTIQHAFNVLSVYGYLSEIDTECGKRIQKGDRIGRAGTSGPAQHVRLHFRIYVNYRGPKDPLDYLER